MKYIKKKSSSDALQLHLELAGLCFLDLPLQHFNALFHSGGSFFIISFSCHLVTCWLLEIVVSNFREDLILKTFFGRRTIIGVKL